MVPFARVVMMPLPGVGRGRHLSAVGPNCPVETAPSVFPPGKRRLAPSWLRAARSTSANLTCSKTSPGAAGRRDREQAHRLG